ncbi:aldo/keto reductase [Streptomyces sp. NPDC053741]|uniref:Aldo/keto reductase n=1 Tax=[Kitasatospora] papulosa TaxID=1464011 RepID=A0ABZ1KBD3_9ACTN|nr:MULTISPECIES: aldo/keto reductase [Streptomyces]MBD2835393.1 aldo/keto reductase [Streptomyces pratensis]MYT55537.1 aldo/keto reductase [Streptomyces sp. SID7834]MCY1655172.1 aldo/keto reductase [Streptomyces sp. SL203]MCY1677491.1 aldo/keto reductase [Streptomyces sp. SL294]MDX3180781.1 aldo/keto reductase [Streptomyces sp. ME02-7008A-1]
MASVPAITLNNGVEIPQLGFGTFQIPPQETRETTLAALKAGYRHIDTAQMYGNEKEVGEAVRDSGLDRGDVFVTSKLDNGAHAYDDALRAFEGTMEKIRLDYLDLFLIHWPLPDRGDFVETWKALEEIYRSGRVKSIGVSNFQPHHLRRLLDGSVVVPAVNQIEVHPYLTQDAVRSFGAEHGIATEAWSPIAQGKVLDDPTLVRIAERVGKSTAQVTLRWHLQRGDIVFPKSVTRRRIEENFDLFDFELTEGDIGEINALNRDERTGLDPDRFNG